MSRSADIVIIGSGIGGASLAFSLADTGRRIVILERGDHLKDTPEARDDVAIFLKGFYRSTEEWIGTDADKMAGLLALDDANLIGRRSVVDPPVVLARSVYKD